MPDPVDQFREVEEFLRENLAEPHVEYVDSMDVPEPAVSEEDLKKELLELVDDKVEKNEGLVMWMVKEDPSNVNGFWNLIWSPEEEVILPN